MRKTKLPICHGIIILLNFVWQERNSLKHLQGKQGVAKFSCDYIGKLAVKIHDSIQFFSIIFSQVNTTTYQRNKDKGQREVFSPLCFGWTVVLCKSTSKYGTRPNRNMLICIYKNSIQQVHMQVSRIRRDNSNFIPNWLRTALIWIKNSDHISKSTQMPVQIWFSNSHTQCSTTAPTNKGNVILRDCYSLLQTFSNCSIKYCSSHLPLLDFNLHPCNSSYLRL